MSPLFRFLLSASIGAIIILCIPGCGGSFTQEFPNPYDPTEDARSYSLQCRRVDPYNPHCTLNPVREECEGCHQ